MARVLRTDVYVAGERYAAGSTPPGDIARRITNPGAWEDIVDPNGQIVGEGTQIHAQPDPGPGSPDPRPSETVEITETVVETVEDDSTQDLSAERLNPPPRSGRGSGLDAWEAFARINGVTLPAGAYGRDDVIDACEEAGLISPA